MQLIYALKRWMIATAFRRYAERKREKDALDIRMINLVKQLHEEEQLVIKYKRRTGKPH